MAKKNTEIKQEKEVKEIKQETKKQEKEIIMQKTYIGREGYFLKNKKYLFGEKLMKFFEGEFKIVNN